MDKKSIGYLVVVLIVAVTAGVILWSLSFSPSNWYDVDTPVPRRQVSVKDDRLFQNDIYNIRMVVPVGWYLHERFDGLAILTKKERLSFSQGTEAWSIGEQIIIAVDDIAETAGADSSPQKWVKKNIPDEDADGQPVVSSWEEIGANRLLRVERIASGTANLALSYYGFTDNNVYRFTLYPYDPDNQALEQNLNDFNKLLESFAFIPLEIPAGD